MGTGVACLAAPQHGAPRILGGHGYLLGDEGGAFWIGRAGIAAVLRAREARAPGTGLAELAEVRFGDLDDLPARLHELARPVDAMARFAPDVLAAADAGDAVAAAIVDAASSELATLVQVAVDVAAPRAVAVPGADAVPVALGGRLMAAGRASASPRGHGGSARSRRRDP